MFASVAPAQGAGDGEPVYKVLQFYGLGAKQYDPKTESVADGLALPAVDDISDADILASEALRKAIQKYHDDMGINRSTWSVVKGEIERIRDMRILARAQPREYQGRLPVAAHRVDRSGRPRQRRSPGRGDPELLERDL